MPVQAAIRQPCSGAIGPSAIRARPVPYRVPERAPEDVEIAIKDARGAELIDQKVRLRVGEPAEVFFELRGVYEGRVINVHPALIPAFSGQGFYGKRVHEAVLEKGVKISGATVSVISTGVPLTPLG